MTRFNRIVFFKMAKGKKKLLKGLSKAGKIGGEIALKTLLAGLGSYTATSKKNTERNRKRRLRRKALKGSGAYMSAPLRLKGSGSYVTNQMFSNSTISEIPSFGDDTAGDVTITRIEYIGDVYGQADNGFYTTQYSINPGLPSTFPWASQVAANYDEYDLDGLVFTYKPVVSDSQTSTVSLGNVIMAAQYNAASVPFASKVEMCQYAGAVSARICDHCMLGVECDQRKRAGADSLMVRTGAISESEDVKTYDWGIVTVAISGVAAGYSGNQLGELWVSYRMRLRKPKFYEGIGYGINFDAFIGKTGVSTTYVLGTAPYKSPGNSIGGSFNKNTNVYTFPDNFTGTVRVQMIARASTSVAGSGMAINVAGNIHLKTYFSDNGITSSTSICNSAISTPSTYCIIERYMLLKQATSGGGNYLTFELGTITGTVDVVQIFIEEANPRLGAVTSYVAF